LATEQAKAHASQERRQYVEVESDEICLLDGPPPAKRARHAIRPSVTPECPVKVEHGMKLEADAQSIMGRLVKKEENRQKPEELNDLLELKKVVDARIQMYGQVSQLDYGSLFHLLISC
jgi:hypothetical protein